MGKMFETLYFNSVTDWGIYNFLTAESSIIVFSHRETLFLNLEFVIRIVIEIRPPAALVDPLAIRKNYRDKLQMATYLISVRQR